LINHTELGHSIIISKSELSEDAIKEMNKEYSVLLICDISRKEDEEERQKHISALKIANLLSDEQAQEVADKGDVELVIPLNTLHVGEEVYRSIPHASHFVTIWVDGKPYQGACA
jgi:CO dehydrogenase/acetyl-CoA synthase epsilon subunit